MNIMVWQIAKPLNSLSIQISVLITFSCFSMALLLNHNFFNEKLNQVKKRNSTVLEISNIYIFCGTKFEKKNSKFELGLYNKLDQTLSKKVVFNSTAHWKIVVAQKMNVTVKNNHN